MAIYLQEIVAIDRGGKEAYLESLRTRLVPHLEKTRGMRLLWVGSTIGSTARWPETMAVWELRDWAHYADVCARMYTEGSDDETLRSWWQEAAKVRLRSRSRTLVGAPFSPTLDDLRRDGVAGTVFAFSSYRFAPGKRETFLGALQEHTARVRGEGRQLVVACEVAFTNDEAYAVWAHRALGDLAGFESERESPDEEWGREAGLVRWSEHWGYAAPGSPLWPRDYVTDVKIW